MKTVIFGAGGPVAAAAVKSIEKNHSLRLTDLNLSTLDEYDDRHEKVACDVSDPTQVLDAAEGMDAIINCTVNRPHPVYAFDVNCRGAFNIMRAAKVHGIRKVVHTGPQLIQTGSNYDYTYDWIVLDDVPPRAGLGLYGLTKMLGQEAVRVFAEECGIQVITLLFSGFQTRDSEGLKRTEGRDIYPFNVTWEDTGEAFRCALEAGDLPRSFEVFHILADTPHGTYSIEKARRLLNWHPQDNFEKQWTRKLENEE